LKVACPPPLLLPTRFHWIQGATARRGRSPIFGVTLTCRSRRPTGTSGAHRWRSKLPIGIPRDGQTHSTILGLGSSVFSTNFFTGTKNPFFFSSP
jgi:hypothetical protein